MMDDIELTTAQVMAENKRRDEVMAKALNSAKYLKAWSVWGGDRMRYAIDMDDKLSKEPEWKERSLEERFKEAERLTLIHFGDI